MKCENCCKEYEDKEDDFGFCNADRNIYLCDDCLIEYDTYKELKQFIGY